MREGRFIDERALVAALLAARFRFIGEVHDDAAQHAVRARLLAALAPEHPAAVMEIFDFGHDAEIAAAQARADDADALATAGALDRPAWGWPLHRPVVAAALAAGLPIRAANVGRDELMALARKRDAGRWQARIAVTPWSERDDATMKRDIVDAHCGALPERAVPAIAFAQRVRDAAMAQALADAAREAGGAVLLAGNGHVRRDLGAPRYLLASELPRGPADIVSVGFIEATADEIRDIAFQRTLHDTGGEYDFVWFTPPTPRPDPCAAFERGRRPRS